ncbi:hypothetical protein FQN54_004855 [Arachnomyces sp. PD_36]|nr:hypothetical protein FQN54_004855 [Arachnomyces sp. PD_36]
METTKQQTQSAGSLASKVEDDDISSLVQSMRKANLKSGLPSTFVDTREGIIDLVNNLPHRPTLPPALYIDLEGINLCREGTISILQIFDNIDKCAYLVDVHTLGKKAFSTRGAGGVTLKWILESDLIPKAFFDVRNDSDALYSHFGIKLAGIHDIQLMELATRPFSRTYVNGLAKCLDRDAQLSWEERRVCAQVKEKGRMLFAPEQGGSYDVFNARPLAEDMRSYCVHDVQFLPRLWSIYSKALTPVWRRKVDEATRNRIIESQSPNYVPNGRHKAMGPWQ